MPAAVSYTLGARRGERDDGFNWLYICGAPDAEANERGAESGIFPGIDPCFLARIVITNLKRRDRPQERDPAIHLFVGVDRAAAESDLEIAGLILYILQGQDDAVLILRSGGENTVAGTGEPLDFIARLVVITVGGAEQ